MITLLIILASIWLLIQIVSAAAVFYKTKQIADKLFPIDKDNKWLMKIIISSNNGY
jgi:hypothetical protein